MTQSLYEKHEPKWETLKLMGFPMLAEMSKSFYTMIEMDHALGYKNAVTKWCGNYGTRPRRDAERRANEWINKSRSVTAKIRQDTSDTSQTFLIVCPPENSSKVQKILALLGCDFVDV